MRKCDVKMLVSKEEEEKRTGRYGGACSCRPATKVLRPTAARLSLQYINKIQKIKLLWC